MRVVTTDGEFIDLGTVENKPTIGIIDYSRRVTDDFGVTTVVERGFSRRMSVRLGLPFDAVDGVQRRLAELRATSAMWLASDTVQSLRIEGFYKDFQVDIAVPPLSYCTLTVEGLSETAPPADDGGDPAPDLPSTLRLLQPVAVEGAVLAASTVAETDHPEWQAGTSYALGAQVIKAATHRIYESVVAANVGHDPAALTGEWTEIGPTNRWAMFDQALGTATAAPELIAVTLTAPAAITGLAVLDTDAGSVRVQAPGYDRTQTRAEGEREANALLFLDLAVAAGDAITVSIAASGGTPVPHVWNDSAVWSDTATWGDTVTAAGSGQVSVGTLLIGQVVALGLTEASPTAGITDYSRKVVDDFGAVTVVQRAWAKRMTASALIRTDAVDVVAARIAAVRARPSLWIGTAGLDALTVYGFFKDFSIEVGETLSKLSLSIEGLSVAAKTAPLLTAIDWSAVGDPDGTKPVDNADVTRDNTANDTANVGGRPVADVLQTLDDAAAGVGVDLGAVYARIDQAQQQAQSTAAQALSSAVGTLNNAVATAASKAQQAKDLGDTAISRVSVLETVLDGPGGLKTRLSTIEVALNDGTTGLASRTQALETSINAGGTGISARLVTVEQTLSAPGTGLAQRTASLETSSSNVNSRLMTAESVLSAPGTGLASRTGTIEAQLAGTSGSTLLSRIVSAEQAISTTESGVATRTATLEAQFAGTQGSNILSRIQVTETAVTDGRFASASSVSTLSGQVGGAAADATFARSAVTDGRFASSQSVNNLSASLNGVAAQASSSYTAVTDGRFASAQRASDIEAAAGQLSARIASTETAVTDGRFATALSMQTLQSDYGGTKATVTQQAGTIAGLANKTSAYVRFIATAGNGRAQLTLSADANGGGGADLIGDLSIHGNLTVDGSLTTGKVANNAVTNVAFASGNAGGTITTAGAVRASVTTTPYDTSTMLLILLSGAAITGSNAAANSIIFGRLFMNGSQVGNDFRITSGTNREARFCVPITLSGLAGQQSFDLFIGATTASGSGDPHSITAAPTILVQQFKR